MRFLKTALVGAMWIVAASHGSAAYFTLTPAAVASYTLDYTPIDGPPDTMTLDGQPRIIQVDFLLGTESLQSGERGFGNVGFNIGLSGLSEGGAGGWQPNCTQVDSGQIGGANAPFFVNADAGSSNVDLRGIFVTIAPNLTDARDARLNYGQPGGLNKLGSVFLRWDATAPATVRVADTLFSRYLSDGKFANGSGIGRSLTFGAAGEPWSDPPSLEPDPPMPLPPVEIAPPPVVLPSPPATSPRPAVVPPLFKPSSATVSVQPRIVSAYSADGLFTPLPATDLHNPTGPQIYEVEVSFTAAGLAADEGIANLSFGVTLSGLTSVAGGYSPTASTVDSNGDLPNGVVPTFGINADIGPSNADLRGILASVLQPGQAFAAEDPRRELGQGDATAVGSIFVLWDGVSEASLSLHGITPDEGMDFSQFGAETTQSGAPLISATGHAPGVKMFFTPPTSAAGPATGTTEIIVPPAPAAPVVELPPPPPPTTIDPPTTFDPPVVEAPPVAPPPSDPIVEPRRGRRTAEIPPEPASIDPPPMEAVPPVEIVIEPTPIELPAEMPPIWIESWPTDVWRLPGIGWTPFLLPPVEWMEAATDFGDISGVTDVTYPGDIVPGIVDANGATTFAYSNGAAAHGVPRSGGTLRIAAADSAQSNTSLPEPSAGLMALMVAAAALARCRRA